MLPSPSQPPRRTGQPLVTRRNVFLRLSTLLAAAPFAGLLTRRAHAAALTPAASPSPEPGSLYKLVTYQLPAEHWQEFLALAEINAHASRNEPGITSFTLLLPQETPHTLIAVEVYKDEAASAAHQSTPHFHAFVQGAQKLGVQRSLILADRYDPH